MQAERLVTLKLDASYRPVEVIEALVESNFTNSTNSSGQDGGCDSCLAGGDGSGVVEDVLGGRVLSFGLDMPALESPEMPLEPAESFAGADLTEIRIPEKMSNVRRNGFHFLNYITISRKPGAQHTDCRQRHLRFTRSNSRF